MLDRVVRAVLLGCTEVLNLVTEKEVDDLRLRRTRQPAPRGCQQDQ